MERKWKEMKNRGNKNDTKNTLYNIITRVLSKNQQMFFVCFLIFSSKYIKIKCDTTKLNVLLEINFLKHSIITCKNIKDWHRHNL